MIFEEAIIVDRPFDDVVEEVKSAFAAEGFGVLTEIDLQATLQAKIGKSINRHLIIGACNPHLAGRAIDVEPQISVLLPCNVVVRETATGVLVEAMDPGLMSKLAGNAELEPIAAEARQLVNNALARLG